MGTDPPQYGQAIDQDTAVPPRHGAIGLLERRRAADGIAVAVAGQDVVPVRLGVGAPPLEQSPGAKVSLGELGIPPEDRPIPGQCLGGVACLGSAGRLEGTGQLRARGLRDRVGEHRAVGLETSFVTGRDHEHRHAADPLAVADDRLEPALEVGHDRGGFRRGHARRVDQVVLVQGGRRPPQAVLAHRLVDQAAERRGETELGRTGPGSGRAAPLAARRRARCRSGSGTRCARSRRSARRGGASAWPGPGASLPGSRPPGREHPRGTAARAAPSPVASATIWPTESHG